jgi:type IV pilus assembly protein PilP
MSSQHQNLYNVTRLKLIGVVFLLFLVGGCQQEKENLEQYVQSVKARKATGIEPLPVMKPYETFIYAASELRDPFVESRVEDPEEEVPVEDNGLKPDAHRQKEALEQYDLEDLQLVGTLSQDTMWGLIRSPDGVIHRVKQGNYMGKNHGRILNIVDNSLTLNEIVMESKGRYIERESMISVIEVN